MDIEEQYQEQLGLEGLNEEQWLAWIQELILAQESSLQSSPLDINLSRTLQINLAPLQWNNYEVEPKKMKLKNTGHTVTLSATFHQDLPFLTKGALSDDYIFSQLHFHWGPTPMEGSEHTVDKSHLPMEMHVVHYKKEYGTHHRALTRKDGIVVLVYFFKVQASDNAELARLVEAIPLISASGSTYRFPNTHLDFVVKQFVSDYYMYWGPVVTTNASYLVLWLIDRTPNGISARQLKAFLSLLNQNDEPLLANFRQVVEVPDRRVFHVNPSSSLISTLFQLPAKNLL